MLRAVILLAPTLLATARARGAETPPVTQPLTPPQVERSFLPSAFTTLCDALTQASIRNDLPVAFFTRLIWQESRLDPAARSPAGAQGVAQFMPGTAAERGLADPFEPARALEESAAYLAALRRQFGNLGLAAAAYNAGAGRLTRWLAGQTALPQETIDYVRVVTDHSVAEWRDASPPALPVEPTFSCLDFAGRAGRRTTLAALPDAKPAAMPSKPWAVVLVGSFSHAATLAEYRLVRANFAATLSPFTPSFVQRHLGGEAKKKYVAQIETDDRAAGDRLCKRLEGAGGNCVVLRNLLR